MGGMTSILMDKFAITITEIIAHYHSQGKIFSFGGQDNLGRLFCSSLIQNVVIFLERLTGIPRSRVR